jgi:hypothetical protein
MLATVTNRARGVRGLLTLDRGTVPLEPGAVALLDLADHPLHRAWTAAREILVEALSDKEAKAARKRLDTEAAALAAEAASALAALPAAARRAVSA